MLQADNPSSLSELLSTFIAHGLQLKQTLGGIGGTMEEVKDLWLKFNEYSNKLAEALGRTHNLVSEYAEYLAHQYYGGRLLEISGSSADIKTKEGKLYQVKSRKVKGTPTTQLNVIRSWKFDYLVVVLFDEYGAIKKALEVPVEVAKEYSAANSHQNGWVITTTQKGQRTLVFICHH